LTVRFAAFSATGPGVIYFGASQILMQDDVGGLEVEDPNQPGGFIVRFVLMHGHQFY
jgi:hypothetical protein